MARNASRRHLALLLIATLVPSLAVLRGSTAAPEDQRDSGATKALADNPDLRKSLMERYKDTFKKLKETLHKAKIEGKTYYFAEGDLRLDEDELLLYAQKRAEQVQKFQIVEVTGVDPDGAVPPSSLIVHVVNGKIMRWEPGSTLTYCILKRTFDGDDGYRKVVDDLAVATKDWQRTCNIRFKHDDSKDGSEPATTPPDGVTFTVRKVKPDDPSDAPIASSFFPGDPQPDMHLLLFPDYFAPNLSFDKVGVLRHELGHVIGFRHEHIRSEAPPVCQGEPLFGAIPITKYDSKSVMHYFCGDRGSRELQITVLDRRGARQIYGAPAQPGGMTIPGTQEVPVGVGDAAAAAFNNLKP